MTPNTKKVMLTMSKPLHPDFEARGDKIHCLHCSQWTKPHWADRAFHHDRQCPSTAKTATDAVAKPVLTTEEIHAAAKAGEISRVLADDEIVDAVAAGVITSDDAMNRDF